MSATVERTAVTPDTAWVIWSHKHGMWWGPDSQGYTRTLAYAGAYSEAEALRIENHSLLGPWPLRSEAMPLARAEGEMSHMRPGSVTWLLTMGRDAR